MRRVESSETSCCKPGGREPDNRGHDGRTHRQLPDRPVLIHQLPLDAALASLRSSQAGLSSADVANRRLEFGPNRIERLPQRPLVLRFLGQFTHFFAVLLWVAALLALIADTRMPGQGMATLAVAIVVVIAVNGGFSFWQQYRAEETMAALQRLLPDQVRVQRDGAVVVVPSHELVPGDVIFLTAGDHVPADCRLMEAFGVRVNIASVTGEARPVFRDAHSDPHEDPLRSRNVLLAGTSLTAGEATALVFATGIGHARDGHGRSSHGTAAHADAPSSERRNAWVSHGDLYRQDRHADAGPHGGAVDPRARP